MLNSAFVFVKPHAVTEFAKGFVRSFLEKNKCKIISEGTLLSEEILKSGIIDSHYSVLATNALKTNPSTLFLSSDTQSEFESKYKVSWADALKAGQILNLAQYEKKNPGCKMKAVETAWRAGPTLKLSPGTYVSKISEDYYVINGFYGSMREKFISPGVQVVWYVVEFPEKDLSWKQFRAQVIGATDPSKADPASVRFIMKETWVDLGLQFQPSTADNSVHASAGPIEGLRERMTWLGVSLEDDVFGKALLDAGVDRELLRRVCDNASIRLPDGSWGPAFDLLEDRDSSDVASLLRQAQLD